MRRSWKRWSRTDIRGGGGGLSRATGIWELIYLLKMLKLQLKHCPVRLSAAVKIICCFTFAPRLNFQLLN